VSLIVAGLIALLKVAVMIVLGQTPAEPSGGASEITVGGVVPGLPALSGSLHPAPIISKECQETHCVIVYLRMTVMRRDSGSDLNRLGTIPRVLGGKLGTVATGLAAR
jgi:hypothetical protein